MAYDPAGLAMETLQKGLMSLVKIGLDEIETNIPTWRGALWQSLQDQVLFQPAGNFKMSATIDSDLPYLDAQENAAKWCSSAAWWPPVEPIREWVAARMRPAPEDLDTVTYFVRRKLGTVGIEAHNFMAAGLDGITAMIPEVTQQMGYDYLASHGL